MSASGGDCSFPPSSQSHFDGYENFTPDPDAPFNHEFARLALSQDWIRGSQQYDKERTIALRNELGFLYKFTDEDKLKGYQNLCREVGIQPGYTIAKCKKLLKETLVNIVDLIDARGTLKKVKVWHNFNAFRRYTLLEGYRIIMEEAKKDGGILASLLQRLQYPQQPKKMAGKMYGTSCKSKVRSKRARSRRAMRKV